MSSIATNGPGGPSHSERPTRGDYSLIDSLTEHIVQNYFGIETEAAFQRNEWARAVATAAQVAQARPRDSRTQWSHLPRLVLARLRSLAAPQLATSSPSSSAAARRIVPKPGNEAVLT